MNNFYTFVNCFHEVIHAHRKHSLYKHSVNVVHLKNGINVKVNTNEFN